MSAMGQVLGKKTGYKNKGLSLFEFLPCDNSSLIKLSLEPRLNKRVITCGIPHRMIATHEALYDIFPGMCSSTRLFSLSVLTHVLSIRRSPSSPVLPLGLQLQPH
jgi:hypothetical protein